MLRWAESTFSALKGVFRWPAADPSGSETSEDERAAIEVARANHRKEKERKQLHGQKLSHVETALIEWSRRRDAWRAKYGREVPFPEPPPPPSPPTSGSVHSDSGAPSRQPSTRKRSKNSKNSGKGSSDSPTRDVAVDDTEPAGGALRPLSEDAPDALKRVYALLKSNDDYEYPDGFQRREVPLEEAQDDLQKAWCYTSRIFRSDGYPRIHQGAEKRGCTGTWVCWQLWRAGRIQRRFTSNELALACYTGKGPEELRQESTATVTEGAERYTRFTDKAGEDIAIWDAIVITEDADGNDYVWPQPPPSRSPSPHSKSVVTDEQQKNSGKRPRSLSASLPPADSLHVSSPLTPMSATDPSEMTRPLSPAPRPALAAPSKKQRTTGHDTSADVGGTVHSQPEVQLRGGTRARRAVKFGV